METEPTDLDVDVEARGLSVLNQLSRLIDFLGSDRDPDEGPGDAAIRLIVEYRIALGARAQTAAADPPEPLTSHAAAQRSAVMLEQAWQIAHGIKDVDAMTTIAERYQDLAELGAVRMYRPPDPDETSR